MYRLHCIHSCHVLGGDMRLYSEWAVCRENILWIHQCLIWSFMRWVSVCSQWRKIQISICISRPEKFTLSSFCEKISCISLGMAMLGWPNWKTFTCNSDIKAFVPAAHDLLCIIPNLTAWPYEQCIIWWSPAPIFLRAFSTPKTQLRCFISEHHGWLMKKKTPTDSTRRHNPSESRNNYG